MKSTSQGMKRAKEALSLELEDLVPFEEDRKRMSKKIAAFTAAAVREDRVHRHTTDALAKLADVFFNGRKA